MTTEAITPNDDDVAPCDNYGGISACDGPCCDHQRQLDHLDTMLHDIWRVLSQVEPLMPMIAKRAPMLLDPGAAMRKHLKPKGGTP